MFNGTLPIPIPVSTAPGLKTFDVNVTDTVGNLKPFTRSLTYDPLQDPTQTTPNELGRPIVVAATLANDNATLGATKTIIRTLSFSGVNVTDTQYRPANPGTQFWGLWVANGALNDLHPDPTKLLWVPVKVASPNTTFSIQWNLFNNYTGNLPLTGRAGQYVVFTKFLDGAGNPSTRTFSTTVTLDPGYSVPTQSLPTIVKP
jgi:hypothetical protein